MSWTAAYLRCNGGEFFSGATCPIDGYSDTLSLRLPKIVAELRDKGALTRAALLGAGLTVAEASRILLVDFPSESDAWSSFAATEDALCEHCSRPAKRKLRARP